MRRLLARWAVIGLASVTIGACDDDEQPPAGDDDTTHTSDDDDSAPLPPGPDLAEVLGPDEARAGVLAAGDDGAFVGGLAAESRPGDVLLYNDRARFVIQGFRDGQNHFFEPGTLVDADVVRPAGQADRDGLDELGVLFGTGRVFRADTLEVIADGSDGGAAVVEARGADGPFVFIEGAVELPGYFPELGLEAVQTWTLEPASPVMAIEASVRNGGDEAVTFAFHDAGVRNMSTLDEFVAGVGVGGEVPEEGKPMLALASRYRDVAVGIFPGEGALDDEGALSFVSDMLGVAVAVGPEVTLEPGEATSYLRYVGVARDVATLEERRRSVQGLATGVVTGTVLESETGDPVAGAGVCLTDLDGAPWTCAVTDEQGSYRVAGEPGDARVVALGDGTNEQIDLPAAAGQYGHHAHASVNEEALAALIDPAAAVGLSTSDGRGRSEAVEVTLVEGAATEQDLELPRPAWLDIDVVAEDGTPTPAVVHVRFAAGTTDPQPADGRLGERRPSGGARKAVWTRGQTVTVPIVAGSYDLEAYHGPRHEIARAEGIEAVAGETAAVTLILEQAYETPGWIPADLHVHGPSNDGRTTMEGRAASVAANDVVVHVATEHDQFIDYAPVVDAMDLQGWVVPVVSAEVSTVLRGHFNIYPVQRDPGASNGGAPVWWEQVVTTSELFEQFRDLLGEDGLIQVNHGRSPGMFTFAGYEPETGEARDEEHYDEDFDAMELLNGSGYGDADELLLDWCSHLDRGLRPVATGVSDSHSLLPGPGWARTYVQAGADDATDLDMDAFFAALEAGRAVVSGGPFVTLSAENALGDVAEVGETITGPDITLRVQVLAPSWMGVDEVRVYGAGCELLQILPVDGAETPVRFDGEAEVTAGEDTYYFVEVYGGASLAPVWPGARSYAVTNPVFID